MSNEFNHKDYGEYFKNLEKQLDKRENPSPAEQKPQAQTTQKRGVYKVIRLRKSVLAIMLGLVIIITSAAVASGFKGKAEKQENGSEKGGAETTDKNEDRVPEIHFTFPSGETPDILSTNDAKCAIIVNSNNNTVVAARNPHQRAYPASTTKIMTLLVAAETLTDLNDTFTMTYEITDPLYVAEASVAGFLDGEEVSINDLLYGTILPSGADAAMGIAIKLAGSEKAFVKLMNKRVEELGLENTCFDNVTGLHSENNYSSAYDMAVILRAAMENPLCRQVLSSYQHTTAQTPQNPNGILLSSTLFSYMYGTEPETATILGGKTGFVNESGYCIASFGKANSSGTEYIVVTLANSARWPAFYGQIDLYKSFAS
ncbi:MAG: D-alanyl-D-alanine carboxypeptidase [Clostridia bacterium]|nr:D-alanyl-D-alanine carboxypeptidase [Clostridia bacterium]